MKRRLLTLFYDAEFGELVWERDAETAINFGPEFEQESPLFRMDVLGDAQKAISLAYEDAIEAWKASEKWRGDRDVQ